MIEESFRGAKDRIAHQARQDPNIRRALFGPVRPMAQDDGLWRRLFGRH
jgi:hypothetical protein